MNNNEELKNKAFEDLLSHAAKIAGDEMVDEILCPKDIIFSDEHNKKMKQLFRAHRRKQIIKNLPKYAGRIAVVFLTFILVAGTSIFSVKAWRVRFLNFVMEIRETNTEIIYKEDDASGDSYSTEDLTLGYIPEGFKLISSRGDNGVLRLKFRKDDKQFSLRVRKTDYTLNIDTENADTERIKINDFEGFMSLKGEDVILTWHDNEYSYTLEGNIPKETIIKIAEKTKKRS